MKLKNNSYIYFSLCCFFYPIFMLFMEKKWLFSGEMWAECGTNYFPSSISNNIWQMFFTTDSGYLSFVLRILALIPVILDLPIRFIPYFYAWSAILVAPFFVAPFCLPIFRKIVASDFLRFLMSIFLLILVDFETAMFINFTYLAIFLTAIITALAYTEGKDGKIPAWSWIIPFLMFTKPSILAMIPVMCLVSFFANKRFKYITAVSMVACLVQLILLYLGRTKGILMELNNVEYSFYQKVMSSFVLFFKYLQLTFIGRWGIVTHVLPGGIFFIFLLFVIYKMYKKGKNGNASLIAIGISLIYCNIFLLCHSLPVIWNSSVNVRLLINRYSFVIIIGIFLMVVSFADILNHKKKNFGTIVFVLWFVLCGFLDVGLQISHEIDSLLYHSKWQKNYAKNIESPAACVPLNPFNWYYRGPGCEVLDFHYKTFQGWYLSYAGGSYYFGDEYRNNLSKTHLESFLLYVMPQDGKRKILESVAYIEFEDGETLILKTSDLIGSYRGVVQFLLPDINKPIKSVRFDFDSPVFVGVDNNLFLIITWLGRSKEIER